MPQPALLALEDGQLFRGQSIGSDGDTVGEVVFNTAMTGYQEILTDPSYSQQIVALTYPHIGNTGINSADEESEAIYAAGLIIRDLPKKAILPIFFVSSTYTSHCAARLYVIYLCFFLLLQK